MKKVLVIFGTRPEAIKLCPVVREFRNRPDSFKTSVCVTAQHRELLDQVLQVFEVAPEHDLDLMQPGQTLAGATSRILAALEPVIEAERPDMIVVQGDTATTFCGALAGFYSRTPVVHVEAGLRTGDLQQPFPEEMNRVVTGRLASLHCAATESAAGNLRAEGVSDDAVVVTGNSGIDAVLHVRDGLDQGRWAQALPPRIASWIDPRKKLIVVTAHRRESFGEGFQRICGALRTLSETPDVQLIYPAHPNPNVQEPVNRLLAGLPNVLITEPLDYLGFVDLMRRAYILLTDSGGIQEEGPSLGKPILVLREKTERPEAVEAGTVILVGADEDRIVAQAQRLLGSPDDYERMSRVHNPYGDGQASRRIADAVERRSFS